ncbi:hypothetical protein ACP4OV_031397 [Aristida adscensionis]
MAGVAVAALPLLVALSFSSHGGELSTTAARRNRFQVNDNLRYRAKDDAVVLVTQGHYDACDTASPYRHLAGGNSVYVLGNSAPHTSSSAATRRRAPHYRRPHRPQQSRGAFFPAAATIIIVVYLSKKFHNF